MIAIEDLFGTHGGKQYMEIRFLAFHEDTLPDSEQHRKLALAREMVSELRRMADRVEEYARGSR